MTVAILFGVFILCFLIGVPIAISLGVSALAAIWFGTDLPISLIAQKAFTSLDSFPLLAIPFFILAGVLMGKGGISKRLLDLATALVGWMTGGLSLVTIVACMFFAAIAGSGPATVAAIGGFMIPAMIARNYDQGFASAVPANGRFHGRHHPAKHSARPLWRDRQRVRRCTVHGRHPAWNARRHRHYADGLLHLQGERIQAFGR